MKKIATILLVISGLVVVSGFGFGELSEYLQVARNNIKKSIKGQISNDMELDRLAIKLRKIDLQLSKHREKVAEAQVAYEIAQENWKTEINNSKEYKENMVALRDLQKSMTGDQYVKIGCSKVSLEEIRKALSQQLNRFRNCQKLCKEKAMLMQAQKEAHLALVGQFESMKSKRDQLDQQLSLLRSRNELEKANQAAKNNKEAKMSELQKANELAEEIEKRLRISEVARDLNHASDESLTNEIKAQNDLESEIDKLLDGEH